MRRMSIRIPRAFQLAAALLAALSTAPLSARSSGPSDEPPKLLARSAILIEEETGDVLYQSDADLSIPPASLTKLMTLHIALEQIEAGKLDPDEEIVPSPNAWARNMPPDSSLMFLGPQQRLSVMQLLEGLSVASGNDAAVEVADLVAGSVPAFAELMNQEAERLGFDAMHFVEPSGISPENRITARQYAEFCRLFIRLHPEALGTLLSLRKFSYPLAENLTGDNHDHPITQRNRNVLLWQYEGTDGLKTGYIDESGYNMAVTAERGGMRLVAVVLGVPREGRHGGERLRAIESEELLNYGFDNFRKIQPSFEAPRPVRVWKGRARSVQVVPEPEPLLVLPRGEALRVTSSLKEAREVFAPVEAGQILGSLTFSVDGRPAARFPLVAAGTVERGGFFRELFDTVYLFFRDLFSPVRAG